MPFGRVRADHHDDVGFVHRVEVLGAGRSSERGLETIAGRRMTHARAGIDVVVAEGRAHQLLDEISLFVGAARGGDPADRIASVFLLNALEFARRKTQGFIPSYFAPRIADTRADHRLGHAIGMGRVTPREASLHARMAVIREAVLVRYHPDDLVA